MKPAISPEYVDSIFAQRQYDGLAWLSSLVCGAEEFDPRAPTYGLSEPLFLFMEALTWFAQGIRSGVCTYFEATPLARQQRMLDLLLASAPKGFGENYALGMQTWRDPEQVSKADRWLEQSDSLNNDFLWGLATQNRTAIDRLFS